MITVFLKGLYNLCLLIQKGKNSPRELLMEKKWKRFRKDKEIRIFQYIFLEEIISCFKYGDLCLFVLRCNLAPVQEYYQDVGWRTNLVTMNPSVVQRAFQDLVSDEWRDRFLQRLQSLSGSVLWIPAFMAKGGEERVEWALRLILLHTVDVRTAFPSLRLLHAVRG